MFPSKSNFLKNTFYYILILFDANLIEIIVWKFVLELCESKVLYDVFDIILLSAALATFSWVVK